MAKKECTPLCFRASSSRPRSSCERQARTCERDRPRALARHLLAACVAAAAATAFAVPSDTDQPMHIQADDAEIDQQRNVLVYRGSVRVDQGTLRVTADVMTVEIRDEKVVRITAVGAPAHYRQEVDADREEVNADASTIIYHTAEERVDFLGEAFLTQDGNEITGEVINYDIVAGKVTATSDSPDRVRMILQPDQNETQ
jgi:lipopolysaccharide export system protein LptA